MSQPVRRAARRTFCPRRPMARESWSSRTMIVARPSSKQRTDFLDFGGLQRVGDEDLTGFVPTDDVDLLTTELVDDVSNAAATNTDAGTDRIDLGIDGTDGQLRSESGLAGHRLDFDDTLRDFGNFCFEQATNEFGIAATQHDLDLIARISDVENQTPDAISGLELFARNLLRARHEAFSSFHLDDEGAAFVALRDTGDDLALTLREFVEQAVTFVLAEFLDHDLLGGLRGDAPSVSRGISSISPRLSELVVRFLQIGSHPARDPC